MLSRILSTTTKHLIKSHFKPFSAKQNLINCFKQEYDHEEKEYKPISSEEKKIFLEQSGFEFIESATSSRMELRKKTGNYEVSICYFARAPMPEEEENQQEPEEGPSNMVDFQVLINKTGNTNGVLIDAVVMDSKININAVHIANSIKEYHTKFLTGRIEPEIYQGPDFSTLDDSLQQAFEDFLNELGVNEEAAAFIEVSSLDKDQQLYMSWLKNAKNILI